jgi:hypothetical protein
MYLCYMDESGDPGSTQPPEPGERRRRGGVSPTPTYTVSAVLVNDVHWVETFENMIVFRRWLRSTYGLPLTAEIKGAQLAKGTGPWRKLRLSPAARHEIYRWAMVFQGRRARDLKTFAVVVRKDKCEATHDVRAVGWQYAFERVNTFTRKQGSRVMLLPDSGQYHWVRALARKMRRFAPVPSAYGTLGDSRR